MSAKHWQFSEEAGFGDDTVRYRLDTEAFLHDIIRQMWEAEDQLTLIAVVEYLRMKGYTVTPPVEGERRKAKAQRAYDKETISLVREKYGDKV